MPWETPFQKASSSSSLAKPGSPAGSGFEGATYSSAAAGSEALGAIWFCVIGQCEPERFSVGKLLITLEKVRLRRKPDVEVRGRTSFKRGFHHVAALCLPSTDCEHPLAKLHGLKLRLVKNRFDGPFEKLRNAECQRE
jgi:hypothetical protein